MHIVNRRNCDVQKVLHFEFVKLSVSAFLLVRVCVYVSVCVCVCVCVCQGWLSSKYLLFSVNSLFVVQVLIVHLFIWSFCIFTKGWVFRKIINIYIYIYIYIYTKIIQIVIGIFSSNCRASNQRHLLLSAAPFHIQIRRSTTF